MQWTKAKVIVTVVAGFIVLLVGDAIAPTWSWECKGGGDSPDLKADVRVMNPRIPENCTAYPDSHLRKGFNYFYPPKRSIVL